MPHAWAYERCNGCVVNTHIIEDYLCKNCKESSSGKEVVHLAVTGARVFTDYKQFETQLLQYLKDHHKEELPSKMISGGAFGVDSSAKRFAKERNIEFIELKPQYHLFKHRPQ